MSKWKRVLALVSDTHVGSKRALWPPEHTTEEGTIYKANRGQHQLYEYWLDFCTVCDEHKVDTVIHLSDACHGTNRKGFGGNLVTPELDVQQDVVEKLLEPLVKGRKFIIISGSGYHQSLDTKIHKGIAKSLGGKYGGYLCEGKITGTSRTLNISHGRSGAVIYRTTVIDRELVDILQAEAQGKLDKIDIVARGHWHTWIHLDAHGKHGIQVPCWCAWIPEGPYLRSYGRMQPDIGGVLILIDEADRIRVWHFLYPAVKNSMFTRTVRSF